MDNSKIQEVLYEYWGYNHFRPLQEEIINSVLAGKDTLGLLSTGGGKSICFQVPGLILPGITLVVSPLIALMRDQVQRLRKQNISAEAVYSGMSKREIDLAINHIQFEESKFLYVSPERLASSFFREVLKNIKLSLLVVDEAHCISQWGYDFRPPYLQIVEIRDLFPDVPVLALTATATPIVVKDIQQKLDFRKENFFKGSFERRNLSYVVYNDENKLPRLLRILKNVPEPAIVYVRNRKKTRETCEYLRRNNISADYYHAGLQAREREQKQQDWLNGFIRVIVCTNAFGMGIDKSDVRTVVHLDLPDSIEAYFQEAGRAGRDGKKSYPVIIYDDADIIDVRKNITLSFPDPEYIKRVYKALVSYYSLAPGTGKDSTFDLDITDFAEKYNFQALPVFNSLKFIEREGYIALNEAMYSSSRFIFNVNRQDLYKFQVEHIQYDSLIKTMQRSYGGSYTEPVSLNEAELARRLETTEDAIRTLLNEMQNHGVLSYYPLSDKPQITFISDVVNPRDIAISPENYEHRKCEAINRQESLIAYVKQTTECRSQMLVGYFGEKIGRCGKCDTCLELNKNVLSEREFNEISDIIKPLLSLRILSIREIIDQCEGFNESKIVKTVNWLIDNNSIILEGTDKYRWSTNDGKKR